MRAKRSMRWILVVTAAACAGMAALPGCELLVEFDRSKIPQEGGVDATTPMDAQGMDAPAETSVQDSAMPVDSAGDAPMTDSATDGPADGGDGAAETGTAMDSGGDTGTVMDSAAMDSAADTGSGMDAGGEAATDAADGGD